MGRFKRVFVIVMDSLGIGAMPDSEEYGDSGVDTLGHIAEARNGIKMPNLQKLGMANLRPVHNVEPVKKPLGGHLRKSLFFLFCRNSNSSRKTSDAINLGSGQSPMSRRLLMYQIPEVLSVSA